MLTTPQMSEPHEDADASADGGGMLSVREVQRTYDSLLSRRVTADLDQLWDQLSPSENLQSREVFPENTRCAIQAHRRTTLHIWKHVFQISVTSRRPIQRFL